MTDIQEKLKNLTPKQRELLLLRLKKQKEQDGKTSEDVIVRQSRDANEFPLSFAQQGMWFLEQFEKDNIEYNVAMAFSLVGQLHVAAFEKSINDLVKRHETLRTTFKVVDNQPIQVISPAQTIPLTRIDLTRLPGDEHAEKVKQLAEEELNLPFDLIKGPLIRVTLLQLEKESHVLFMTIHHIVFDGWSKSIFYNELSTLYRANVNGTASSLPVLEIEYADYSSWQNKFSETELFAKQLNYWKKQLKGAPPEIGLPADRPRAYLDGFIAKAESFNIDPELSKRIKTLASQAGTTIFMVFFSAYALLLSRYCGHLDIVVGVPVANRNRKELEQLIGLFVNTIVVRVDLSGNINFLQLLERTKQAAQEGFDNQDIPFKKLVEEINPDRDLSYTPIFQVMFNLLSAPGKGLALEGLSVSHLQLKSVTAGTIYDLKFTMDEDGEKIKGLAEYNADLFDPATVQRMVGNFQMLLEGCIENPDQSLATLPLLTPDEKQDILVNWNQTDSPFPQNKTVHELVKEQMLRTPHAIAAEIGEEKLTYRELDLFSNALAKRLKSAGVGPGVLVGIFLNRSLDMLIALQGVLRAGGAYVPMDPEYPRERLAFMVEDAGVRITITHKDRLQDLPVQTPEVICIDRAHDNKDERGVETPVSPHNLAYVIYTSGSTGKPKGVKIPHKTVVNFLTTMKDRPGLTQDDVLFSVTSLSFDIAVLELFLPLTVGGKIVIASGEEIYDGKRLLSRLQSSGATVMQATPASWRMLVDSGWDRDVPVKVMVGGEALPVELAKQLLERSPSVWNMYGPTETTIWSAIHRLEPDRLNCIGKPIANTQFYVLDSNLLPVPVGVPGELHIGGAGLAEGYLNRPDLTADRFIDNPFGKAGTKLYKTGDLVRYQKDGSLEYLGRMDNQVKVRGFRIELGEIESVLNNHEAITECAVITYEDKQGDTLIGAYFVSSTSFSTDSLRNHLKKRLPDYMIPNIFINIDALPLTPNGKVDRKALSELDVVRQPKDRPLTSPRTPVEESIAEIWSELLEIDQVGVYDNFFDLGGHSLLATQVISRIREIFQKDLPLRALFDAPTVAELASQLDAGSQNQEETIQKTTRPDKLPLSFSQQRLWFLEQFDSGNAAYNIPVTLRLKGELSIPVLEQALCGIIERHEVLRTCFPEQDGKPVQSIRASMPSNIKVTDLSDLPEESRESQCRDLATQESRTSFDIAAGPLIRARVFRLNIDDHVLVLSTHHIVSDGWSLGLIMRELGTLYRTLLEDKPSPLDNLPIQYADFTLFQREWFQGQGLETQKAYWRKQLSGIPAALELPTDYVRPSNLSGSGEREFITIPASLDEKLQTLSRENGVTLFMTLLAGFQTLLYRYSNQEDIVIGSPVANRNRKEIEPLIGFFVNTLVLRLSLAGNLTFKELLERVKEMAIGAFTHQDIPFEQLVEEFAPQRSLNHTPLFQVMFTYEHTTLQTLEFPGIQATTFNTDGTGTAKFDLTLSIVRKAHGLKARLEYNTDLFHADTIRRMLNHYLVLLENVVSTHQQSLSQIPLLTPDEKQDILVNWNQTDSPFPQDKTIHGLFEIQAEKTPDSTAVIFNNEKLTYRQLNESSNQLAHHLLDNGVSSEQIIGIYMDRSAEMVIAFLSVLKAGCAYLPMDPAYPQERLAFMQEDSQVAAVLTRIKYRESLPVINDRIIYLDADREQISHQAKDNPCCTVDPANLAYVVYTSGTTGKPKGVLGLHRAVVNLLNFVIDEHELTEYDIVFSINNFSFDPIIIDIYLPLITGAKIVLADPEILSDGAKLLSTLQDSGATFMDATPATWQMLVDAGWKKKLPIKITCGGEALPRKLADQLLDRCDALWNCYGPTECTIQASLTRISSTETPISIGKPIANIKMYILDSHLQPVPVGVPGELHIGGACMTRGYLNRPELMEQKFIPNPFSDQPESRLYKTGDLTRYLADGSIEFLGRLDDQVKIRGYRIELGEIETVLRQHGSVQDCVVITRKDASGTDSLIGYVVMEPGHNVNSADLSHFLKHSLPQFMVPSFFLFIEELPLTSIGKVDRKALRELDKTRHALEKPLTSPRTPLEESIVEIWSELLEIDEIGIHDNFFELGGHSLLATQMVSRIRTMLNIELPLSEMFEHQTVAELTPVIDSLDREKIGNEVNQIPIVERSGGLPLSFAQERLWFLDQLEPDNAFYNMPLVIRLRGELSVSALTQSLNLITHRHQTLRTRFDSRDGMPIQLIDEDSSFELLQEDLSDLCDDVRDEELEKRIRQEALQPFDLEHEFSVRARLLRLTERGHVLLFTMHHIISDGWSVGLLFKELGTSYEAFSSGRQPELPKLPVQYADFASWQREWLSGEVLASQLDYWKNQLDDLSVLELPTDRPRPPLQTYNGAIVRNNLSKKVDAELERFSQQHGGSLFMTLLAAFAALMYRYSGQQDIVVGSPIANRNRSELEGLIGFFVNSLVMRTDVSGNPSFTQLIERVNRSVLGAFDHQDLPFEKLVDELQPDRDLSRNPIFQIMFALQNASEEKLELQGLTLETGGDEILTTRFDLEVHIFQRADQFRVNFIYNTDLFDHATMERLFSHYQKLLETMLAAPETRIDDAPMLGEQERQQLLIDWNQTATDYPRDKTVHQLFERQAAATPDSIAVEYDDKTLSYRELNERANRLAHYLRARQVGPEVRVGLFMERSPDLIVALLGILKAGGAYVPLDLDYPSSRITFMLEDAQVPVLVSASNLIPRLPELTAELVCLDRDWAKLEQEDGHNPEATADAENLAYVIYTSGSTGTPKGVEIQHRAITRLVRNTDYYQVDASDRIAQASNVSFDAATFEFWGALLNGARLVGLDKDTYLNSKSLAAFLQQNAISAMFVTTAVFNQIARETPTAFKGLKGLMFGGEAVDPGAVRQVLASEPPERLLHVYGPTESTTFASWYQIEAVPAAATTVPIGRPLANTTLYVLDANMNPVPVGVPGELYIGGDGIARGYLNRAELTAEKFVSNPFDSTGHLYRTGDKVRYRSDGAIEFLGRFDHQVKVRGFRIELGEIENALLKQEALHDAVVIMREDEPGDKRIAAYLVPSPAWVEQVSGSYSGDHVDEWKALYEETYGNFDTSQDLTSNFSGWNSSYTGEPIPLVEMEEWMQATVTRIGALQPKRVLEIGCGTGLLLYRLAPACERYVGTDFSAVAQQQVRSVVSTRDEYRHVELWQRLADDFSDVEAGDFDTVIINSVTQYLPSMDYLVSVIESSVKAIGDGGRIMLGDIRSLSLLQAYHASVQLYLSPDDASASELLRNIQQHVEEENELVIEPAFFFALQQQIPRLSHVEILLKRGQYHNELTGYRYDVVLHVAATAEPLPANGQWLDWGISGLNEAQLQTRLTEADQTWLGIRAIPNARIAQEVALLEQLQGEGGAGSVGELKQAAHFALQQAVEPNNLWRLAESAGYHLELCYTGAGTDGRMDALFRRTRREDCAGHVFWPQHQKVPQRPWSAYGSNPLKGKLGNEMIPLLRQDLQQQLPEYMMPSVYVVLDDLPLNPNGKVDRKALPVPGDVRASLGTEYTAPRSELEQQLAEIWAEVLKLERVGVHDNFFDLGGHSLMATQVVSRIRGRLNVELPLSEMFGYPTVSELAPMVQLLLDESVDDDKALEMLQRLKNLSPEEKERHLVEARKVLGPDK